MKNLLKNQLVIVVIISVIFYSLSMLTVFFDKNFTYRWLAFSLHILSFYPILLYHFIPTFNRKYWKTLKKGGINKEILILVLILISGIIINFVYITNYPFVSVGDEVRDSGLNALQIFNGSLLNIFSYGRYDAHGLIIPTVNSFFYYIFGSSVLTYRFPSAFLASLDILIVYIIVRLIASKIAAVFSALVLLSLPLHIFFGRTQTVVAFNSFWAAIISLFLFILLKRKRTIDYVLLGSILGFSFGFHASIRAFGLVVLLSIFTLDFWKIIVNFIKKMKIKILVLNLSLLLFFSVVGFGPRLIFTDTAKFFHTSRFVLQQSLNENNTPTKKDLQTIGANYIRSVTAWIYAPVAYHYADLKPIFSPVIGGLFIIGIFYSSVILRNRFLYILIFLSFIIPFTNSAITDVVNADHRLSPLFPVGAILAGLGVFCLFKIISNRYVKYIIGLFLLLVVLLQLNDFFINQLANKNKDIKDYLSMHIIYFLKSNNFNNRNKNICLSVSPSNYQNLNLLHYQEQYIYFLPNLNIKTISDMNIGDNEVYILKNDCFGDYKFLKSKYIILCKDKSFYCPLDYKKEIDIYY